MHMYREAANKNIPFLSHKYAATHSHKNVCKQKQKFIKIGLSKPYLTIKLKSTSVYSRSHVTLKTNRKFTTL